MYGIMLYNVHVSMNLCQCNMEKEMSQSNNLCCMSMMILLVDIVTNNIYNKLIRECKTAFRYQ